MHGQDLLGDVFALLPLFAPSLRKAAIGAEAATKTGSRRSSRGGYLGTLFLLGLCALLHVPKPHRTARPRSAAAALVQRCAKCNSQHAAHAVDNTAAQHHHGLVASGVASAIASGAAHLDTTSASTASNTDASSIDPSAGAPALPAACRALAGPGLSAPTPLPPPVPAGTPAAGAAATGADACGPATGVEAGAGGGEGSGGRWYAGAGVDEVETSEAGRAAEYLPEKTKAAKAFRASQRGAGLRASQADSHMS